ncbi:MAG: riboflavin synthase subunit alpha [Gammaproteobacteria bacterium]|nr:riboflavin synthase subunit alpha [Gammaproteobacteria bacterium]
MFTGIVQGTAEVVEISVKTAFRRHRIRLPEILREGLRPGASVAHNGCCLTVAEITDDLVSFDLMQETLKVTNLGLLTPGDRVNIERAARFGDEIGGHQMSGHIICLGRVIQVVDSENNRRVVLQLPDEYAPYLFPKGYIGIDGISLTIGRVDGARFDVNLIPETLARTTIAARGPEDLVNIEIDPQTQAIVDTVTRLLGRSGLLAPD